MLLALHLAQITDLTKEKPVMPDVSWASRYRAGLLVFPEQYIFDNDSSSLAELHSRMRHSGVPFLVGDTGDVYEIDAWAQVAFLMDKNTDLNKVEWLYNKHTSAGNLYTPWEDDVYDPHETLPVLHVGDKKLGVTICHDLYLSGLHRYYARQGVDGLVNITHFKVKEEKWGTMARLRALENGVPFFITLHADKDDPRHHLFAFDANGQEKKGIWVKDGKEYYPHEMWGGSETYCFEIGTARPAPRKQALQALPDSCKNELPNDERDHSVLLQMKNGRLAPAERDDSLLIHRIDSIDILNPYSFFEGALEAYRSGRKIVFWNYWKHLDVAPAKLVHLLLGRSLEFCAPVVLTDENKIYELTELATDTKVLRRCAPRSPKVWVDMQRAFGLRRAFAITCEHLLARYAREAFETGLKRYASLFSR